MIIKLFISLFFFTQIWGQTSVPYTVDLTKSTTAWNHYWEQCVGSGHATLTLREDWRKAVTQAHSELGFQYIRFHGLLDDDMSTSMGQGQNSYVNVDSFVDFLLSIGMKPIFELSFMPTWLASGNDTVCHYKGNITPPKSYSQWGDIIKSLGQHLVDRYGIDAVATWWFEVWNEPGIGPTFWTGTQQDYWNLYNASAVALKSVSSRLRVGGPSCNQCTCWITDFMTYMKTNNIPYDFISTHCYGGGDSGIGDTNNIVNGLKEARNLMGTSIPFLVTEYSSTYAQGHGSGDYHDTVDEAAFLIATVEKAYGLPDYFSYWVVSDIFEEMGFPTSDIVFHGGFGLLTIYQVPKPSYRAFQLLHESGTERVAVTKPTPPPAQCTQEKNIDYYGYDMGQSNVASVDDCCNLCWSTQGCTYYSFQVSELVCMLKTSDSNKTSNNDRISGQVTNPVDPCLANTGVVAILNRNANNLLIFAYNHATKGAPAPDCTIAITLNSGNYKVGSLSIRRVDKTHANPLQAWIDMGKPQYLNQNQIDSLIKSSQLVTESLSNLNVLVQGNSFGAITVPLS